MDRSAYKSSKNETSLKFERGPQSSNLDDNGAYVSFDSMGSIERLLKIKFGYESSGYEYSRDIFLDFEKVVELKKHIDSMIEYEALQQKSFYFFSYGSNLFYNRIKGRCNSVEVVEPLKLTGFKLVFNKLSKKDSSAKANILKTDKKSDEVWGVVHRISWNDKPTLDKEEGLGKGYNLKSLFELNHMMELNDTVMTYISTEKKYFTENLPYDWYLRLIIEGAEENGFPSEYINDLKNVEVNPDSDECRKLEALSVINSDYALQHFQNCK